MYISSSAVLIIIRIMFDVCEGVLCMGKFIFTDFVSAKLFSSRHILQVQLGKNAVARTPTRKILQNFAL